MATRALAINTFTYPSGHVAENVLWTLQVMREDFIARQLGAGQRTSSRAVAGTDPARRDGCIDHRIARFGDKPIPRKNLPPPGARHCEFHTSN